MAKVIDREEAVALLHRALELKGENYVYNEGFSCQYERNGGPSCIVGYALHFAGVSTDALSDLDAHDDTQIDMLAVEGTLEDVTGVKLTPDALKVFTRAQEEQDRKVPWGKAVAKAQEARWASLT